MTLHLAIVRIADVVHAVRIETAAEDAVQASRLLARSMGGNPLAVGPVGFECSWEAGGDPASGCHAEVAHLGDLCDEHAHTLSALDDSGRHPLDAPDVVGFIPAVGARWLRVGSPAGTRWDRYWQGVCIDSMSDPEAHDRFDPTTDTIITGVREGAT